MDLPEPLQQQLVDVGITTFDEISLRQALEKHSETYTLYKLAPWPARRWKCHYRLMMGTGTYDGQNIAEAYARALLAAITEAQVVENQHETH